MNRKAVVLSLMGLVLLGLVVVIWMVIPAGPRRPDFRMAGDSLRVGDKFVTLVVALRTPSFFESQKKRSRYGVDLVLHDVADVSRAEILELTARSDETKLRNEAKLLGTDGRRVWVYADTLVGFDLSTRQRVGFQELSKANPSLAQFWVDESKFYSVGGIEPKLRLKVADARQFELDPATLVARAYEKEQWAKPKDYAESQKQWVDYYDQMSMFGVGPDVYFWQGEKVGDGEWFSLMTGEEAGKVKESGVPTGRASRSSGKTSGLWTVKDREAARVGAVEYLDAGLLRDEKAAKPMRLEGPPGYLVMHQSRLGADGTLMLTRVDLAGKKIWEVNTGIGKLYQVLPGVKYLGLIGDEPKVMISVSVRDGSMTHEEFSLTSLK